MRRIRRPAEPFEDAEVIRCRRLGGTFETLKRFCPTAKGTRLKFSRHWHLREGRALYLPERNLIVMPRPMIDCFVCGIIIDMLLLMHEFRHSVQFAEGLFHVTNPLVRESYRDRGIWYNLLEIDANEWAMTTYNRLFRGLYDENIEKQAFNNFVESQGEDFLSGTLYGRRRILKMGVA